MSAKVFDLGGERRGEPVPEVVELLEGWLEKAREGRVHAVAVVAVCENAELLTSRVENDRWAALLAAHDISKHAMLVEAEQA